ncbi:UNVERIFIED_CONTAM: hypothetical protein FKN15_042757 [Acipenser sinensis]
MKSNESVTSSRRALLEPSRIIGCRNTPLARLIGWPPCRSNGGIAMRSGYETGYWSSPSWLLKRYVLLCNAHTVKDPKWRQFRLSLLCNAHAFVNPGLLLRAWGL